jgi:hypothetical protein
VANGTYKLRFGTTGGGPTVYFELREFLQKGVAYRFELRVHRIGANAMQFHARVYDAAGALLYSDADFKAHNSSLTLADGPTLPLTSGWVSANCLRNAAFGTNGSTGTPVGVVTFQGAVAVRLSADPNGWIGPYRPGEGP